MGGGGDELPTGKGAGCQQQARSCQGIVLSEWQNRGLQMCCGVSKHLVFEQGPTKRPATAAVTVAAAAAAIAATNTPSFFCCAAAAADDDDVAPCSLC
jgi:hypothetical protein